MKNFQILISVLLLSLATYYSFSYLMPESNEEEVVPPIEFSVDRAMTPLIEMTKEPHYLGSDGHKSVQKILLNELQKLGLQPHYQEAFTLNSAVKTLTKPRNILARIEGSGEGKALMLVSHYDSALVPSFGAADNASGVVTILESVRAYLASGTKPKNDIILLFTDGEELALDGAKLFMDEHPWAKEVGLALNFEARGTSGPSNMILETNQGNAELIKEFIKANPSYPVASSLMYSVYKILPNDTDSTVFREAGDIDGFFFAFIDNHFNYHTAEDNLYNLNRNSLMHQGSYLLPLLYHFGEIDLSATKSGEDHVYFNFPGIKMMHYSFIWIFPLLILAWLLFFFLLSYGLKNRIISLAAIFKGFSKSIIGLITAFVIGFFGWKLIMAFYPHYAEIQQGFTYNGHSYIAAFVCISIALCFFLYRMKAEKEEKKSFYVGPLFLWLILNTFLAIYLKGATYFILPVFFGLLSFFLLLKKEKTSLILISILAIPAIIIFAPLVQFFPVGLGLSMVVISCILTVLLFYLLLPIFIYYRKKGLFAGIFMIGFLFFFIKAHTMNQFSEERKKPNSLVYFADQDAEKAYWTTFDRILDSWTETYLGNSPEKAEKYIEPASYSKYGRDYTFATESKYQNIEKSIIHLKKDGLTEHSRVIQFVIEPQRKINKIELYSEEDNSFSHLKFNGKELDMNQMKSDFRGKRNVALINYFVADNDPLEVEITLEKNSSLEFKLMEYSFDLMTHPLFNIRARESFMMPKPFVLTDAVVTRRTVSFE